jgi:phosphocarrier protein
MFSTGPGGLKTMQYREIEIINKLGLHARAAAKLVNCATRFVSVIEVERRGQRVNCKSIMGIMMLAASRGSWIIVEANGEDEDDAIAAIEALIGDRFGEGE